VREDIEPEEPAAERGRQEMSNGVNGVHDKASESGEIIPQWVAALCCTTMPSSSSSSENNNNNARAAQKTDSEEAEIDIPPMTKEQIAMEDAKFAKDDPKWGPYANVTAMLIIIVCSFFWGYYA